MAAGGVHVKHSYCKLYVEENGFTVKKLSIIDYLQTLLTPRHNSIETGSNVMDCGEKSFHQLIKNY